MNLSPVAAATPRPESTPTSRPTHGPGDWPFTSKPPARITDAAFDAVLKNVPDRDSSSAGYVDSPDRTAQWAMYAADSVAQYAGYMVKGFGRGRNAEYAAEVAKQTADYGRLTVPGASTWLRSSPRKVGEIRGVLERTASFADVASRYATDPTFRASYGGYSFGLLVNDTYRAAMDLVKHLQREDDVRTRPIT